MTTYAVTNPATGEQVQQYATATDSQIEAVLDSAHSAFGRWKLSAPAQRAALLHRVADLYQERREALAAIITREMGKPLAQAAGEIDIVVSIYRYYAQHGADFLADEQLDVAAGGQAVVRKQGLGALLGIMPWNYPYYQVARFAAPNLMNGNSIVLKHAPQCPESALAMEQIFIDAGLEPGAYVNVFATNEQVATMIADWRIAGVSLTGSERAGSAVAELAGRHLKKVVLELGGSDPFLVLDPADLDATVKHAVIGRMGNAGQACNAAKRFVVSEKHYEQFVQKFTGALQGIEPGDPAKANTFLGPLSSLAAAQQLAAKVDDAVAAGAVVLTGGKQLDGESAFFEPTVLAGVTAEMDIYHEELFGPVAMVFRAESEEHAVQIANDSSFGLGASVHTADLEQAWRVADLLEAGMVYINEASGTSAELPFGGVKRSGIGRELGKYGMEEFVNRKLIRVAK
ncbi:NAD-dependent succinate-semialdehyde dehydrogenase [Glutamicibacter arilaitensis]|uniref:NAD-dependent succinate-semialdehyde dehydrogenase n=1 Tax=Glutamicibacter arilaitensis TaxID=256701 RepID=UPI003A8FA112